jgi:small-conductance mechanosensitive channel
MEFPIDLTLANPTVEQFAYTLLIIVAAFILTRIAQRLVPRYIEEPARRYRASKFITRIVALTAIAIILAVWSPGLKGFLTVLTVVGAGLAIAMREVVLSFFGWVNLTLRSPFSPGDRVEINGVHGDVIDIRLLHSTFMEIRGWVDADQSTGRIVHIPNSWVYQYPIYNYTHGFRFIWNEIALTVTFRSNWQDAREIMLALSEVTAEIVAQQVKKEIQKMSREYLVHYSILTPFVYVRIMPNGVRLTLRYLCETRKRRGTEHALTLGILDKFREHGSIELAPTMVGVMPFETPQFGEI